MAAPDLTLRQGKLPVLQGPGLGFELDPGARAAPKDESVTLGVLPEGVDSTLPARVAILRSRWPRFVGMRGQQLKNKRGERLQNSRCATWGW